jgi:hypothetical protein
MRKNFLVPFVFLFLLFPAGFVFGQVGSATQTDVSVTINPSAPEPNQTVTATASSYSTNLDAANISWSVNGKTVESGVGLKSFSFTVGAVSTVTVLGFSAVTQEGQSVSQTLSITPAGVDLIWQSFGYTPPFYEGKSLFSHQGIIEFVALPHFGSGSGGEVPAGDLIYKWTRDGTVLGDFSGYGKSTYTMLSSIISRPVEIDVQVTSPDSDQIAEADMTVTPSDPTVVLYEKSPLYGILFQRALTGTVNMGSQKEMTVLAEPFYFGVESLSDPSLQYSWSINNSPIDSDTTQSSRVFRPAANVSGSSNVSVSLQNSNAILQQAESGFNLSFGNTNSQ